MKSEEKLEAFMTKLIKFDNNKSQMLPSYYSTILNLSSVWSSSMNYESLCVILVHQAGGW